MASASGEFVTRLDQDLERVQHDILHSERVGASFTSKVVSPIRIRGGRSVLRVDSRAAQCVMYKPKDLRLDVAWHSLVERLNCVAPVQLRAAAAIAGDGYGWTEFVDHTACDDAGCGRFFRRAGAWLALFHCFAAGDIHHENLVAAGDHPVPIDVETLLQAAAANVDGVRPDAQAYEAARELIADSVTAVGLLPAYGKSATGVYSGRRRRRRVADREEADLGSPQHRRDAAVDGQGDRTAGHESASCRDGRHIGLAEHVDDFVAGFGEYARFLSAQGDGLFDGFAGLRSGRSFGPPSSTRCC